jgi:hypothetical protein
MTTIWGTRTKRFAYRQGRANLESLEVAEETSVGMHRARSCISVDGLLALAPHDGGLRDETELSRLALIVVRIQPRSPRDTCNFKTYILTVLKYSLITVPF